MAEMEKATLIVTKNKKGKIITSLQFENNKRVPVQKLDVKKDVKYDGKTVDVLREKGLPVIIKLGDEFLLKKNEPDQSVQGDASLMMNHLDDIQSPADAPYNFIPLNQKIVPVELKKIHKELKQRYGVKKSEIVKTPGGITFDRYKDGLLTGWIDLDIKTVTPVYIRGTIPKDQIALIKENKNTPAFFSPGGKLALPGSSIRGMVRNMVEIVSYGKFGFFDDKTHYFRGLADISSLRSEYGGKMSSYDSKNKKSKYKALAGVIRKNGISYELYETSCEGIPKTEAEIYFKGKKKYEPFSFINIDKDPKLSINDSYIVVSGDMENKKDPEKSKKQDWVVKKPDPDAEPTQEIPEKDIESYKNDKMRHVAKNGDNDRITTLNLIELLDAELKKKNPKFDKVPCFFVRWKDTNGEERVSFGHTPMFRLAYEKSVKDHIPENLLEKTDADGKMLETDIAGSIFGNETLFSGRVFFEDALIADEYKDKRLDDLLLGVKTPKILSDPKPTTFQHYLVQNKDNVKSLKHYNNNSVIRGNKLYWHKKGNQWKETDENNIEDHGSQYTKINPVRDGVHFTGRIRFENLTEYELGALIFALNLPEGCYHKIGMGKPLGLGSIMIQPKLYLSERKKRYAELFSEWDEKPLPCDSLDKYTDVFEDHVKKHINENVGSLWETDRLKELKIMLNYEIGKKIEAENKSNYMIIDLFRKRNPLPRASIVSKEKEVE